MTGHLQLHGVVPAKTTTREGLPDHQLVECGPICAIVSDFPEVAAFESLPPEEVAKWALTHHTILTGYCADHAVLPMRAGAVFSGMTAIAAELDTRRGQFCLALEMLKGLQEFSLQIIVNETSEAQQPAATSGRDHLVQRRRLRNDRKTQLAEREVFARELLKDLDGLAYQVEPVGAPKPERLVNCVALLPRDTVPSFLRLAQQTADRAHQLGLEVVTTGPWPAYSFDPAHLLDLDRSDVC